MTSQNKELAWQATRLISYNLSIVFDKISTNQTECDTVASISTPIFTRLFLGQIPPIPRNMKQMKEVEELISLFCHQTLNSPKFNFPT